jgi:hypothetical protein
MCIDTQSGFVTKFILILLIALVFEAIGVVFLSGGLNQITVSSEYRYVPVCHWDSSKRRLPHRLALTVL